MRGALLLGLAVIAAFFPSSSSAAVTYAYKNVDAPQVYIRDLVLICGKSYTFETTALSTGCDTVLHLWDVGAGAEVAMSDDLSTTDHRSKFTFKVPLCPFPLSKNYKLVMHPFSNASKGTANVLQDGAVLDSAAPVTGNVIAVLASGGYYYETALVPSGTTDTVLIGLNSTSGMVAMDSDSGVGLSSRISGKYNVSIVVLGAEGGAKAGKASLFLNDWTNDKDGDGLGAGLEAALQTCDAKTDPYWYCASAIDTRDTDHDGLSDMAEVFGVDDAARPQYLPRWGANPLHKDGFIEVDYLPSTASDGGTPVTQSMVDWVQQRYLKGTANELQNPDGNAGVALHFDIGFDPSSSTYVTLYGNWGGSNMTAASNDPDYYMKDALTTQFTAVRAGYFRYALAVMDNGGQGTWNSLKFNKGSALVFAHELGHTFALAHAGHSSWGDINCKPNYTSLMSYTNTANEFSHGANTVTLNPSNMDEPAGVGGSPACVQTTNYWYFETNGNQIDWNRDGLYLNGVRGFPTMARGTSCATLVQNTQSLKDTFKNPHTPKLLRFGDRLYVFYVGDDNYIYYRQGQITIKGSNGSCPGGSTVGAQCMTWAAEKKVTTTAKAKALSALFWKNQVLVAFLDPDCLCIRTIYATGKDASGNLTGWTGEAWVSQVWSSTEPELSAMYAGGGQIGLFYLDRDSGEYRVSTAPDVSGQWTAPAALKDSAGAKIYGKLSPAVIEWPSYSTTHAAYGTNCAVLPENVNSAPATHPLGYRTRVFCRDASSGNWADLTTAAFGAGKAPITYARPTLAFHMPRTYNGEAASGDWSNGQFWMAIPRYYETDKTYLGYVYFSESISKSKLPAANLKFDTGSRYTMARDVWSALRSGTGIAMYEDPSVGALKGAWVRYISSKSEYGLEFMPLFDGSFNATMKDGNDFYVMERGACWGIKNTVINCGTPEQSKWKY